MAGFLFNKFAKQIRTNIIAGILLIIPLFVSIFILLKLFVWIDNALPGVIGLQWTPGIGVLVTLIIAYFAGLTAKNYVGKRLIAIGNAILCNIPILNKIYMAVQQIMQAFTLQNKNTFDRVVLIEFPKAGVHSIGFLTSDSNPVISEKLSREVVSVFVPTTPNPTTGYLLYVPEDELVNLNIPVESALKIIMSAGVLSIDSSKGNGVPTNLSSVSWMGLFKRDAAKVPNDPRD